MPLLGRSSCRRATAESARFYFRDPHGHPLEVLWFPSDLNYGLPNRLELNVDAPYLAIFRDAAPLASGAGDTNIGLKWNIRSASKESRLPAMGVSFYVELPTGDARRQLGSGLVDYWLNIICKSRSLNRPGLPVTSATYSRVTPARAFWESKARGVMYSPAACQLCVGLLPG